MASGLLYVAADDSYLEQAREQATRNRTISDYPIAVVTDSDRSLPEFDHVIRVDDMDRSFRDKAMFIPRTPFEKTIYLDSDTWVVEPSGLDDLFQNLEYVDLAAAFDIARTSDVVNDAKLERIPMSLPMLNTGVIAFKNTSEVSAFFEKWQSIYQQHNSSRTNAPPDQPSFRQALANSPSLRYSVLPPEYNFIIPSPQYSADIVKILHGNADNHQEIANSLNSYQPPGGHVYHPVYTSRAPPPRDRRINHWVAGTNEGRPLSLLAQSVREVGLLRTLAVLPLGGPTIGRNRLDKFSEYINERGLAWTLKRIATWPFRE